VKHNIYILLHSCSSTVLIQGRLIAPFFVCRFCSYSGLLVRIPRLFCVRGVFSSIANCQICLTGAFTGKFVVKYDKQACETVHSTPKETCQYATQFDRPCKTACFWWVKETPKDAQECDLGLCKFVGHFHVFPHSYLRRGACSAQKRPAKDAPKIAVNLPNPRRRTSSLGRTEPLDKKGCD